MASMEQRILNAIASIFSRPIRALTTRARTRRSAQAQQGGIILAAADDRNRVIDFVQELGVVPDWILLETSVNCQLFYVAGNEGDKEQEWMWGTTALVEMEVEDENWTKIRLEPAAFPCRVQWFAESVARDDTGTAGGPISAKGCDICR